MFEGKNFQGTSDKFQFRGIEFDTEPMFEATEWFVIKYFN